MSTASVANRCLPKALGCNWRMTEQPSTRRPSSTDRGLSNATGLLVLLTTVVLVAAGTGVVGVLFHTPALTTANPDTSFVFEYTERPAGNDTLNIRHDAGDGVPGDALRIEIEGASAQAVNGGHYWTELGGQQEVVQGTNVTISTATVGTESLDLSGASIRIIVEDDDKEYQLDRWDGPDA